MIIIDSKEKKLGDEVISNFRNWRIDYRKESIDIKTDDGYDSVGDYSNEGMKFLVEAKLMDDFWKTFAVEKRLEIQLEKVTRVCPDNGFLATIGYLSELFVEHPHKENFIMQTLARTHQQWGSAWVNFEDSDQFSRWLVYTNKYTGTLPKPVIQRNKMKAATSVKMLVQIEGIGEGMAKALLEHFGNVYVVMSASVNALTKVPKLGKVKANAIKDAFMEVYEIDDV